MERYSTLWGTDKAGVYGRQGASKRLSGFLMQKIGAANVKDTVELTERIVTGIKMLPGYEKETLANKPLAVVYAPLYLNKKPGMPKDMKGFCALAVSGVEHRVGRKESTYGHTFFFSRQDMLTAGEYNYLDLLMGTHQITSQDVRLHRNGTYPINFERLPQKVEPLLVKKDLVFVCKTIEALYQKKNVVLILEEGANFNRRAMELLAQLYFMMQPMLATETGFATYQTQERIQDLSAETNVQVYVVPAGAELNALPRTKFEILNLAGEASLERTPVTLTLVEWTKYDWKRRCRAMEHLFAKNDDYLNADLFVKLSKDFFAQAQALNTWFADNSKEKSISTIEQLQAEDKTQSDWKLVPWAQEFFNKKYPTLLKDSTVEVLNARNVAAFYEYNGADKDLKSRSAGAVNANEVNSAAQQYQYGRKLAGVNEAELSRLIWEKADQRVGVGYRKEIDGLNTKLQNQESEFKSAWENREQAHNEKLDQIRKEDAAALAAAVAAEVAKTAAVQEKLDAADQVHAAEVEKLNQAHQGELQQRDEAHGAELENVKQAATQKLEQTKQAAAQAIEQTKQAAAQQVEQANQAAEQAQQAAAQRVDQANRAAEQVKQAAQNKINNLNGELGQAYAECDRLKGENAQLRKDRENDATEIANKNREIDRLQQEYRIATGQEIRMPEPPKESGFMLGPVEIPKKAVPIVAGIVAAAFLVGALVSGVIVGLLKGGKDDPDPIPTVTTTAPVETTTAPPETTTPPTTVPPTTVPPETEPQVFTEDGQINWDYFQEEITWIDTVETDPAAMEELLAEHLITAEGWEADAVLLPDGWAIDEEGVVPSYITVLHQAEAEETNEDQPAAPALALLESGRLVVDNGTYCLVVHMNYGDAYQYKWNTAMRAALGTLELLSEGDTQLSTFAYMLEDDRIVDLQALMITAEMPESWWMDLYEISMKEQALTDMSANLGTQRATLTALVMDDGTEGGILDYAKNAAKADEMVGLSQDKNRSASHVDDYVLVLLNGDSDTNSAD